MTSRPTLRVPGVSSSPSKVSLGRRREQLEDTGTPALYVDDLPAILEPSVCYVTAAPIASGFLMEPERLAVYAAADIMGRGGSSTRDMRKMPAAARPAWILSRSSLVISSCMSSTGWADL